MGVGVASWTDTFSFVIVSGSGESSIAKIITHSTLSTTTTTMTMTTGSKFQNEQSSHSPRRDWLTPANSFKIIVKPQRLPLSFGHDDYDNYHEEEEDDTCRNIQTKSIVNGKLF